MKTTRECYGKQFGDNAVNADSLKIGISCASCIACCICHSSVVITNTRDEKIVVLAWYGSGESSSKVQLLFLLFAAHTVDLDYVTYETEDTMEKEHGEASIAASIHRLSELSRYLRFLFGTSFR